MNESQIVERKTKGLLSPTKIVERKRERVKSHTHVLSKTRENATFKSHGPKFFDTKIKFTNTAETLFGTDEP